MADNRTMGFFDHLEELRQRVKVVLAAFILAFVLMLTFAIVPITIAGTQVFLPIPTAEQGRTIPSQLIVLLNHSLVQGSATLTVLTPWEAVIAQMKVAAFLAAVIISPVSTYEFWSFVAPALKPTEQRLIFRIVVPIVMLFLFGVLTSLLVVLPFTFPFLYAFAGSFGATALLRLDEFLDFVLWFSLAFGLAFELPVFMYGLSFLDIVQPSFWRTNWRYAVIAIFIFGAIITPDGSGITMLFVSIPMLFLYAAGYIAVLQRSKVSQQKALNPRDLTGSRGG